MPTSSLRTFAQALPVCQQTAGLAEVLEIFQASGCDTMIAVNEQRHPLGVIKLRQVLPHLIAANQSGENGTTTVAGDSTPLSGFNPPLLEPITILPAHLSLHQFWSALQQKRGNLGSSVWVLVEEDGTVLGRLNSQQLLTSLASNLTTTHPAEVGEEPLLTRLNPLVQLLEQLPLPLSLQTTAGQVLAQNPAWRQQVGESLAANWVSCPTATRIDLTTAELGASRTQRSGLDEAVPPSYFVPPVLTPEKSQTPCKSALALGIAPYQPNELPRQAQHYCAIAAPHMAAAISQRHVMESALKLIEIQDLATTQEDARKATSDPPRASSPLFSFTKIPLSPLLTLPQRPEAAGEVGRWRSPSLPELCVVLAQATAEPQATTQDLVAQNADLVQLNRLKDEFLACITHELKTPLTAVLGLSTLLKSQALGKLNDRQARYAQLIYQSGRQLMTVVNDILDLTRLETGQLELTLEPVHVRTVCDRAYSQAQQLYLEKNQRHEDATCEIHFTLNIEPGLETLIADELRLRQMLMHLLSNAFKFTDTGGDIGLEVSQWDGWIAFTVWDTGIGISPEQQHLIFQKFQQLEKPLTRRFEGTGLGLVLTQRLAHLHGGDVSFVSKPNEGSEFTLLLPPCPPQGSWGDGELESGEAWGISQSEVTGGGEIPTSTPFKSNVLPKLEVLDSPYRFSSGSSKNGSDPQGGSSPDRTHVAAEPAESCQPKSKTQNRLVLVVETVLHYLEGVSEQLKSLGYRVVIARSGPEAIKKARHLQPCAILLNPLLPQLSGWDVLTLIKSDAQTQHIPVLVTATQADKQQANHHKADGFLCLPVQTPALLQSLTRLEQRQVSASQGLTILHLSSDSGRVRPGASGESVGLTEVLGAQPSELNYRVLEADDLDQAELLARIWNPDVVLLDSAGILDPVAYLAQFSSQTGLSTLPLVTLDRQTTEAANQVPGLSVYPCLASDQEIKTAALLQVIQVAAGINRKPSVLVMDTGEPGKQLQLNKLRGERVKAGQVSDRLYPAESQPYTPWLQALIQYLQTAGFRSSLSQSWSDVCRQIQDESVDVLLIRLEDTTDTSAVVKGLISLTQVQNVPPILVLDHRLNTKGIGAGRRESIEAGCPPTLEELAVATCLTSTLDEVVREREGLTSVESLLSAVATKTLYGHAYSMSQLLEQIDKTLAPK